MWIGGEQRTAEWIGGASVEEGGKKEKQNEQTCLGGREEYKNMKNKTPDAYAKKKEK